MSKEWFKSDLPYRPCVGICLFNQEQKVLVAERLNYPGNWQMPQGGIDQGESAEQAALRELKEEVGVNKVQILAKTKGWLFYNYPDHIKKSFFNRKYRGQKQIWFAMRLQSEDSEINLQNQKPEFMDWKWVYLNEVAELIVPFKKKVYQSVVEQFQFVVETNK